MSLPSALSQSSKSLSVFTGGTMDTPGLARTTEPGCLGDQSHKSNKLLLSSTHDL